MILFSTSKLSNYWETFPASLRIIINARLWTAIGAGGVLYLSPMIFNNLGFTAEQIGSGITAAAFAGIVTRLVTGYLLDNKYSYEFLIKVACLIAIISDFILFYSQNFLTFLLGQFSLGAAAGIYWPSAELAVPLNCNKKINSTEGYAIARSADAIGVTIGILIGTFGTYLQFTRIIYLTDIICMLSIFYILINKKYKFENSKSIYKPKEKEYTFIQKTIKNKANWIIPLFPLLLLTLFITGVMNLLQSILPLDLANGGLIRVPFNDSKVASLISIKLIALAIFQWPVGYAIRNINLSFKFILCLISLITGFILLLISNFLLNGYLLILISFVPITFALCIFLPSASDAIIKLSPIQYRGSAVALYSQCFGVSALTFPWMAGKLIDNFETSIPLWLIVIITCIFLLPICKNIN